MLVVNCSELTFCPLSRSCLLRARLLRYTKQIYTQTITPMPIRLQLSVPAAFSPGSVSDNPAERKGGTLLITGDRGSGKNSLSKGIVSMGRSLDVHVFDVVSKVESGRFASMSRHTTILHPLQMGWGGWPLILDQIIQVRSRRQCPCLSPESRRAHHTHDSACRTVVWPTGNRVL